MLTLRNAVKRSALEQKKAVEEKQFGAIDYDAPISSDDKTIGFGTKIGIGAAVVVFGLVFAFGDFLPSGSVSPTEESAVVNKKLSEEGKATLQSRLKEFEATLSNSPKDPTALEGVAVTLAELGEYARAASLLDDLTKVYKDIQFEVLRGLSNSLLAAKKPEEAVQLLLAYREHPNPTSENLSKTSDSNPTDSQNLDPVQLNYLGKAYSDWGHVSDAIAVYDQLISTHPNDFRGYLAKARFFAPDKAKALVDCYSR
ncbi:hypothetical protein Fmac_025811 [Flemingia macrophylla]|uniref:Tetratricopeptide repeat (TPR)-like superfamily protein n=1 Tax=Flemingia macrophylla TaxID=520843 RepID=A0ABD1LD33_9FABA